MAVRMALDHPGRVSRLVLIDAGGYRDQDWERIQSLISVQDLAGVDRLYEALFFRVPWMMRFSRATFLRAYTSRAVRGVLEELSENDTFQDADLARLRMPTALIWAEQDGLFTIETARAMAAAIPRSRLEIIRSCGHAIHMECPRGLVSALERFRRATGLQSLQDPEFTVIIQPFGRNTMIQDQPTDLLSTLDCFHPSLIAHEGMAIALWNNLITPSANKKTYLNLTDTPLCPTEDTLLYTY